MNCSKCKVLLNENNGYKKKRNNGKETFQSKCKSCFNEMCVDRWRKLKQEAIEYKGGECFDCKTNYHYSVYEFHHLDPKGKDMNWTKMRLVSHKKRKEELDKCVMLCANCHRMRHYGNL